jgi:hypothetical protein
MLKIRYVNCFEFIFCVERLFQALTTLTRFCPPIYGVESHIQTHMYKCRYFSGINGCGKLFCLSIHEQQDFGTQSEGFFDSHVQCNFLRGTHARIVVPSP